MKPPKIERHSFTCMYCNKKRVGDRPWDYREETCYTYGHYVWWFNRWWAFYHRSKRWWRWFVVGKNQVRHMGFYHVRCKRADEVRRRLLR